MNISKYVFEDLLEGNLQEVPLNLFITFDIKVILFKHSYSNIMVNLVIFGIKFR